MHAGPPVKLLIVEVPARPPLRWSALLAGGGVHLVGTTSSPADARDLILAAHPDVILLDLDLPGPQPLALLAKLQQHYPVPVVVCCLPGGPGSRLVLRATRLGAVDVWSKPAGLATSAHRGHYEELLNKIHAAALAHPALAHRDTGAKSTPSFREAGIDPRHFLIVVGASTGGTEALKLLLRAAPADCPPMAIVQHIPREFTASLADHLNQVSPMHVAEAQDHEPLLPGRAYLATGRQMGLIERQGNVLVAYGTDRPCNRHCPSVDVLFESASRIRSRRLIGVLLTGMGADGAAGLLQLRQAGAVTIAQDRGSCVVYGMPRAAVALGAVQWQCPPQDVPRTILRALSETGMKCPRPQPPDLRLSSHPQAT